MQISLFILPPTWPAMIHTMLNIYLLTIPQWDNDDYFQVAGKILKRKYTVLFAVQETLVTSGYQSEQLHIHKRHITDLHVPISTMIQQNVFCKVTHKQGGCLINGVRDWNA